MTMPAIETARLRLRPFKLNDVDAYHRAILADDQVMQFLPGGKPLPRERALSIVRGMIDQWEQDGFGLWAVTHQQTGELIGHCGLQPLDNRDEVELAYAIARAHWRQGFASEAAEAALRYGFEALLLEKIVAVIVPENRASQGVLQKLGLKFARRARVYHDVLPLYEIERMRFVPAAGSVYRLIDDPA
jgi:RimJ/RimL family protein N-acetyltransferase